jgi:hypothetical protein
MLAQTRTVRRWRINVRSMGRGSHIVVHPRHCVTLLPLGSSLLLIVGVRRAGIGLHA